MKGAEKENRIDEVPEEILLKILNYLCPYYEYGKAQLVCRKWCRIIRSLKHTLENKFVQCILKGNLSYSIMEDKTNNPVVSQERSAFRNRNIRRNMNQSHLEPAARFSHCACVIGEKMYIFGGCSSTYSAFNDLFELDLMTRKWQRIVMNQGFMPAPRECASMLGYECNLVIFGGWSSPRFSETAAVPKFFNDTHFIDTEQHTCKRINSVEKETPGSRAGHNACISEGKMVVFGGAQRILRYDDVWFLDMKLLRWYCPSISGKKPEGRFGHSQNAIGENHIVIIGGCGGSNSLFEDAWLLNTRTWSWSEIRVENKLRQVPDLWCHPSVKVGDQILTYSDQIICNTCLGSQTNPLESALFAGPVPIPSITCVKCGKGKIRKQHADSHFQMYTLDCSEILTRRRISWGNVTSLIPQTLSYSRSLFSIVAGKGELLIFGGVFNSEKLKITNVMPLKTVIVATAK